MDLFFWAYKILWAIKGIPPKDKIFLLGNRLDPPRAGIMAIVLLINTFLILKILKE
jgi:hypothetical protein